MSQPFEMMAKEFATRMRSKVHQQSFSTAVMERATHRLSPVGRLAVTRIKELVALQERHRRSLDLGTRTEATQLLRTLPLLSTDEDPQFVHTQRALRAAAYFDAVDLPVTHALINHHTRNAFLLDAVAMSAFLSILASLRHPRTADILSILLPRLRELSPDLDAREGANALWLLRRHKLSDDVLTAALAETMARTAGDAPLHVVRRCALVLSDAAPAACVRVLAAAERRLCDELLAQSNNNNNNNSGHQDKEKDKDKEKEKEKERDAGALVDVCRAMASACGGPRRLLNAAARAALAAGPRLAPDDAAEVLRAFHRCSYRHAALLRGAAATMASAPRLSGPAAATALHALAHFYIPACEDLVLALVGAAAASMDGLDLALALLALLRLRRVAPGVDAAADVLCDAPLQRYVQRPRENTVQASARLLYALVVMRGARAQDAGVAGNMSGNIKAILEGLLRRRGPLPEECRAFVAEAVSTLEADATCTDESLRGMLSQMRERLANAT